MTTIGATKFKEQCLSLLDHLDDEGLTITKHGKPVAKVIRFNQHDGDLIGSLKHKAQIRGDIYSTGIQWEVDAKS